MTIDIGELQPSYITVDPTTGKVGANFSGKINASGLDLPADVSPVPPDDSRIRWLRVDGNGGLVAQMIGFSGTGTEELSIEAFALAQADTSETLVSASDDLGSKKAIFWATQANRGATASLTGVVGGQVVTFLDQAGQASFPQLSSVQKIKILGGYIDGRSNPPGVLAGSGFTATKTGTGAYTITFTTAFSSFPCVGVACGILGNNICRVPGIGSGSLNFQTITLGGAAVDEFVGFIAFGAA